MNETWTSDPKDFEDPGELGLEDLVRIFCEGDIDDELRERLQSTLRTDPRLSRKFEQLEAMQADAGSVNLWQGFNRNQELDCLLEAGPWEDPSEILHPEGPADGELDYRQLIAVADARAGRAEDPRLILEVRKRLLRAEQKRAQVAALAITETLRCFSDETAERVFKEVRQRRCGSSPSAAMTHRPATDQRRETP